MFLTALSHKIASRLTEFQTPAEDFCWFDTLCLSQSDRFSVCRPAFQTIRFDFSGNGHSAGKWRYGGFDAELHDLKSVVQFVKNVMLCKVAGIVGHSKGCSIIFRHAAVSGDKCTTGGEKESIPAYIAISPNFHTSPNDLVLKFTPEQQKQLKDTGAFLLKESGGRQFFVSEKDTIERMQEDTHTLLKNIEHIPLLIVQGDHDDSVSVDEAYKFGKALNCSPGTRRVDDELVTKARKKGQHRLIQSVTRSSRIVFVRGADHNFNGKEYVNLLEDCLMDFLQS